MTTTPAVSKPVTMSKESLIEMREYWHGRDEHHDADAVTVCDELLAARTSLARLRGALENAHYILATGGDKKADRAMRALKVLDAALKDPS